MADIAYTVQRSGLYVASKHLIVEMGGGAAAFQRAATVVGEAGPMALAFNLSPPMLATFGLLMAVSAGLSQMDFLHKKNTLKNIYRDEASARFGKPVNKLSKEDFKDLEKENPVLSEEMTKARRQRNFGIALSFLASVASVAAVVIGLPALGFGEAYFHAMPKIVEFAAHGLVAVLSYNAVKAPLHWIAGKMFGLDDKTAHDRITDISRQQALGKAITPEQVLSVYAAANPQVDRLIEVEYGKPLDAMAADDRKKVAIDVGKLVPLERLAQDISNRRLKATALALAVDGEDVGMLERQLVPKPEKPGLISAMWRKISGSKPERQEVVTYSAAPLPGGVAVEYASESPGRSFVERVGVSRSDTPMGHVERLEQSRRMAVSHPVQDIG